MKNKIYSLNYFLICMALAISTYINAQSFDPLSIDTALIVRTCNIGNYGQVIISVPTEALTGDNIPLSINLPSVLNTCTTTVTITNTPNLEYVQSTQPFVESLDTPNTYICAEDITSNNGLFFFVYYKFPGGITYNSSTGTFYVRVDIECEGETLFCTAEVDVIARAENYWAITKEFVAGNLICGTSLWKIKVQHNNPNGTASQGLGAYNLEGTITENTSLPIISIPTALDNLTFQHTSGDYYYNYVIRLQNCVNQESTITNTADYNFTLGNSANNCGTFSGLVSAESPLMEGPDTSLSFTKYSSANGGIFTAGCEGVFTIRIKNDGNTPWTDFTLEDDLNIPGISIGDIQTPNNSWTVTPNGGVYTFEKLGFILDPGQIIYFNIYFEIDALASGSISNTALLNYSGGGGTNTQGPNPNPPPCSDIVCPTIVASIENKSVTNFFTISPPQAIPSIAKCNEPYPSSIPIKQVGETIRFRVRVGNSGSALLDTEITDAMDNSGAQNLSINTNPITVMYYPNQSNYSNCGTSGPGVPFDDINVPGASWDWNENPQNPVFYINGLPGNCELYKANYAVIEFEADILPQLSGSKTNTAEIANPAISASANYTITTTGELQINKIADTQFAENGDSFNYYLTISNMGSDPLKNVVLTDQLPACVQLNGTVTVTRGTDNILFNQTPNVIIEISPTEIINPGESFVIKIPVIKTSGTECCNEIASATAIMESNNQQLNANVSTDEIACVQSNLCCDIEDFSADLTLLNSLYQNRFRLDISAGVIPIQEVEVSMIDYHVVYSDPLCQPANMGIFGYIFSPHISLGSLLLTENNSHSLSWLPGSPVLLNHFVRLDISRPSILNLSCCNGRMYFCLKVKIKDIECNICEKIVCGSINLRDGWWSNSERPYDDDLDIQPAISPNFKKNQIRPEFKEQYKKMLLDRQQKLEIKDFKRQQEIKNILNSMDPSQAEDYMKQLNRNSNVKGKQIEIALPIPIEIKPPVRKK